MSEVAPGLVLQLLEEEEEEVVVALVELGLPGLVGLFQQERRQAVHEERTLRLAGPLYRPFQRQTRGRSSRATIRPSSS